MKKCWALLFVFSFIFCLLPISTAKSWQDDNDINSDWQYGLLDDGTVEIRGYKNRDATTLLIPEELNGRKVTVIGSYSFFANRTITEVIIPESVISINTFAFTSCSSLVSVRVSDSVKTIDNFAFEGCKSLTSINLSKQLTSIGSEAFKSCSSLSSIELPESLTSIGDNAFEGTSITQITIPKNVTDIGTGVFNSCNSLTSITVETEHPFLESIDGVLYNKKKNSIVRYPCAYYSDVYTIPNGIEAIDSYAFSYCPSLKTVVIPDSVISLGDFAFSYSKSLTSIVIPNNIASIPEGAFSGCKSLIDVSLPQQLLNIEGGAFYSCQSLITINIPDSVTVIGAEVFEFCESLDAISIPYGITSIERLAFNGCHSLKQITLPDSVTSIGFSSFSNCKSIKSINLPNALEKIYDNSFMNCVSLADIVIPESVKWIGDSAFIGCPNLKILVSPDSYAEQYCKMNHKEYSYVEAEQSLSEMLGLSDGRTKYISEKDFYITTPPEMISVTRDTSYKDEFYRDGYGKYSYVSSYMKENNLYLFGTNKNLDSEVTLYIIDYDSYDFNTAGKSLLSQYMEQLKESLIWGAMNIKSDIYHGNVNTGIRFQYYLKPVLSYSNQYIIDYYTAHNNMLVLLRFLSYSDEITEDEKKMIQDMFDSIEWRGIDVSAKTYTDLESGISFVIPAGWNEENDVDNETTTSLKYRIGTENVWISYAREDLWEEYVNNHQSTIEFFNMKRSDYDMLIFPREFITERLGCEDYKITSKNIDNKYYYYKQYMFSEDDDSDITFFYFHNAYLYMYKLSGENWYNYIGQLESFLATVQYED